MKENSFLVRRKFLVLILWVLALLAMTPAVMVYSHYVSYANSQTLPPGAQSVQAQHLLSGKNAQNQSLLILILANPFNGTNAVRADQLQNSIMSAHIRNLSAVDSPFSAYSAYLDSLTGNGTEIISAFRYYNRTAEEIFSFPSAFYFNWKSSDFNRSAIMESANESGFNSSAFERNFLYALNSTYALHASPQSAIENAINISAVMTFGNVSYVQAATETLDFLNYTSDALNGFSHISFSLMGVNVTPPVLIKVLSGIAYGKAYVSTEGLRGAPSFISFYIGRNGESFFMNVIFNLSAGTVLASGFYPSESAFPKIASIASSYFGREAYVTGNGAIAYETQQSTSKAGFAFAFIFIVLAIAVGLTLYSYKLALLSIIIVSISTFLGYFAIFVTGIMYAKVNYVVNYTLTAVLIGISTDYFIFLLSRYRQEIREGRDNNEALETAISRAGKAVALSGLTVAASLGTFSLVSGFQTWGITLFVSILLTVLMVTTLVPSLMSVFGKRLFSPRGISSLETGYYRNSFFYRTTVMASRKKFTVATVILLLALPSIVFFFTVPTTYNFQTGLPASFRSVQGLNLLEKNFGAFTNFPIEVIVNISSTLSSGKLTDSSLSIMRSSALYIIQTPGIKRAVGPFLDNSTISPNASYTQYLFDSNHYALFTAYTSYGPYSQGAIDAVLHLRQDRYLIVGGLTSSVIDEKNVSTTNYEELAAFILIAIALILLIAFRTYVYPLVSLSGVFLSISWTVSMLYLISLYILHQSLIYLIPVILFVILMSLGNDYAVFIITRVREETERYGFKEGLGKGMASTGRLVTSLGLILAASLGVLAIIPSGFLEQLGIAFIISLVLDTFVVRLFYFPAMLSIFHSERGS